MAYKEQNTVERLINNLKAWRGSTTRYDKTPESYLAGLHLRASMMRWSGRGWSPGLAKEDRVRRGHSIG